jgi:hypothetical protein
MNTVNINMHTPFTQEDQSQKNFALQTLYRNKGNLLSFLEKNTLYLTAPITQPLSWDVCVCVMYVCVSVCVFSNYNGPCPVCIYHRLCQGAVRNNPANIPVPLTT